MKKRYWIAGAATLAVAGKLLLRPRDADFQKCREVVFHSEHSCFVDVDGIRVHYQEAGDERAPAMVLIHGFASSTLVWSRVFLKLAAAGYRVIAPDMLGYGYSARPLRATAPAFRSRATANKRLRARQNFWCGCSIDSAFRARSWSVVHMVAQWLRLARSIIRIELRN